VTPSESPLARQRADCRSVLPPPENIPQVLCVSPRLRFLARDGFPLCFPSYEAVARWGVDRRRHLQGASRAAFCTLAGLGFLGDNRSNLWRIPCGSTIWRTPSEIASSRTYVAFPIVLSPRTDFASISLRTIYASSSAGLDRSPPSPAFAQPIASHLPRAQDETRLQPSGCVGRSRFWVPELIDDKLGRLPVFLGHMK
jgi:hypothetical protein